MGMHGTMSPRARRHEFSVSTRADSILRRQLEKGDNYVSFPLTFKTFTIMENVFASHGITCIWLILLYR